MRLIFVCILLFITGSSFSQAPTADFSASPLVVCIGDPINFTDLSTPGGFPITTWSWDFGDGNSSNQINPSHTYAAPGSYTITLVVTASNGQADPEVKPLYVIVNPLPNVGFTTSGNGCTVPFDVTFTNTSSVGANFTYSWDFGNAQTSLLQNPPPITYSAAGTYTVVLIVTNTTTGCLNSFADDIVISDFSANFNIPASACVNEIVAFQDLSTVGVNAWSWNFGDAQTSNQQNPNHSYGSAGTYTVTLISQNTVSGCSDTYSQDIVINALPVPSFTADVTTGCAPLAVTFTNTSAAGTSFSWNFGNGNTFNGANPPIQTYLSNGSYSVSLSMTDANGCTGSVTIPNYIVVSSPVVEFSMDFYNGCEPLTVQFTDLSTSPNPLSDPIVSWEWDFGDGSPITFGQVPPPHDYNVGIYSVTLTIITSNGCQQTLTYADTIQVGSIVNVDFSVAPLIECAKTPIDFTDLTTFNGTPDPGEVIYSWDFGDGGTSSQQNPTYEYPSDTGYFDVTLVVDWRGCIDSMTITNAVYILAPISLFTPAQTLFCNPGSLPITLDVTDNAIHGLLSDDVEMIWDWGDGTFTYFDDVDLDDADLGSTSHDYFAYGSYTIEQVIINYTTGCSDSTTQTIHVSQTIAGFTLSNDSTCVGSPISLGSTSTSSHPFGTFVYNMGNGGSASGNPANYTYNSSGSYNILLTATNSVGCSDTSNFIGMDVLALPQALITPSETTGCAPITVSYTNSSTVVGNGVPLASFLWTFPDLTTQVTTNVLTGTSFFFPTEGVFTTTLVVTDEFGCVSPVTSVTMTITKPAANFTLDSVVCDLESFTGLNGSLGATSYEWFVDGIPTSVNTNFTSSFDEVTSASYNSVTHNIQLIATDAIGCKDTVNQDIVVSMPRADINYILTGANVNGLGQFTCPPVFAEFTDNSDSFGTITNWNWDFGDGKFSTLQDPNNTYVFSGTYSASLVIIDEFGCTNDTTLVDFLTIFGPSGDPGWAGLGDICGQSFNFEATNLSNVSNIIWDLGNGTIINDTNLFNYTYLDYNTFNPTATLVDSLGCEVIYPLPEIVVSNNGLTAFFQASPIEGAIGTTFIFDESSTYTNSPIITWTWDVGGNTYINSNGNNLALGLGLPGVYAVTLIVTDADGCFDTYNSFVTVTDDFSVPNVITANGDGTNDLFILPAPVFESFNIVILNRWGNVLHERKGATGVYLWDGYSQSGTLVNDGVYFYLLTGVLVSGKEIKKHGTVTVVGGI